MEIVLHRQYPKPTYTIGKLYIDGQYFCDTCEDTDRGLEQTMDVPDVLKRKIKNETAIPTGEYIVRFTYSPRFKRLMPQIENVKGFSGVRMHGGNSSKDTDGCPLFGDADEMNIRDWVSNSQKQFKRFDTMLQIEGGNADLHIVWDYDERNGK